MMYEVSQPLSPNIGQSVRDWGVAIIHKPESQAAVCILDGSWLVSSHDYCMTKCMY